MFLFLVVKAKEATGECERLGRERGNGKESKGGVKRERKKLEMEVKIGVEKRGERKCWKEGRRLIRVVHSNQIIQA